MIEPARERGLAIATGHFMFEVRPPLPFTKGTAVRRLLDGGDYLSAMACGDDLTDVTLFAAVRDWGERDARRRTAAVAAVTDETPQPVTDAADVLVRATPGVHEVLSRLVSGRRRLTPGGRRRRPRQRPVNSGARFSRNAAMPSVWSSVANASAKRSRSMP